MERATGAEKRGGSCEGELPPKTSLDMTRMLLMQPALPQATPLARSAQSSGRTISRTSQVAGSGAWAWANDQGASSCSTSLPGKAATARAHAGTDEVAAQQESPRKKGKVGVALQWRDSWENESKLGEQALRGTGERE